MRPFAWAWAVVWIVAGLFLASVLPFHRGQVAAVVGIGVGSLGFEYINHRAERGRDENED